MALLSACLAPDPSPDVDTSSGDIGAEEDTTALEVIDDAGRIHQVSAQSIFSPTAVLKGGKQQ